MPLTHANTYTNADSHSAIDKNLIIDPFYNPVAKYETVSVLDKYPITNKVHTKIFYYDNHPNYNVKQYMNLWRDVWDKNRVEVFMAQLSSARSHKENYISKPVEAIDLPSYLQDGDVYDPWYRNITQLKGGRYTHGDHKIYNESFAPNGIEQSVIYQYNTTIDKVPVKILLYQNFISGFLNKKIIENHYKVINPFNKKIGTNYDLEYKDI